MMIHTEEKPFQCPACGQHFMENETFIEHMKIHNKDKPYNCRHCQKSFLNNIHLKRHMKRHTGEESYQCKHCDKTFLHMSALKIHEKLHNYERPYQCSTCNRVFSNSNNSFSHVVTYSEYKSVQCSDCDKTFSNNTEQIHIGEKPYIHNNNDFSSSPFVTALKTKTNNYQVTINSLLIDLGLPLETGRVVTTNGNCFYDSVLALLEDPNINKSIASHAKHIADIREYRDLRLALH